MVPWNEALHNKRVAHGCHRSVCWCSFGFRTSCLLLLVAGMLLTYTVLKDSERQQLMVVDRQARLDKDELMPATPEPVAHATSTIQPIKCKLPAAA